jgi:hypothetical protein
MQIFKVYLLYMRVGLTAMACAWTIFSLTSYALYLKNPGATLVIQVFATVCIVAILFVTRALPAHWIARLQNLLFDATPRSPGSTA